MFNRDTERREFPPSLNKDSSRRGRGCHPVDRNGDHAARIAKHQEVKSWGGLDVMTLLLRRRTLPTRREPDQSDSSQQRLAAPQLLVRVRVAGATT